MSCSIFIYYDRFVGDEETYIVIHKDIFPSIIKEYDHALTRVRNDINKILLTVFNGKFVGKFHVEPAISISSYIIYKCPESRIYELEVMDQNMEHTLHGFSYQNGRVIRTIGNIDGVIAVWKKE